MANMFQGGFTILLLILFVGHEMIIGTYGGGGEYNEEVDCSQENCDSCTVGFCRCPDEGYVSGDMDTPLRCENDPNRVLPVSIGDNNGHDEVDCSMQYCGDCQEGFCRCPDEGYVPGDMDIPLRCENDPNQMPLVI